MNRTSGRVRRTSQAVAQGWFDLGSVEAKLDIHSPFGPGPQSADEAMRFGVAAQRSPESATGFEPAERHGQFRLGIDSVPSVPKVENSFDQNRGVAQ